MRWIAIAVLLISGCATQRTARVEVETKAPDYQPTIKVIIEVKG